MKKTGQKYETYNNINKNSIDYKMYDLKQDLIFNEHDMLELKFNLSDAVLLGSSESVSKTSEVINKFQLGFDMIVLE